MSRSVAISVLFHAALLLAALFVLPKAPPFKVKEPTPIVVDLTTISAKVQQQASSAESKTDKEVPPEPKVAEKLNTAAHEQPAPPPEPIPPTPPPPPELKASDEKAMDDLLAKQQAAEKKKEEAKKLAAKKAEEKKKADEKKKKLDKAMAESQALLNKIAGEAAAPKKATDKKSDGKAAGDAAAATATLTSALVSKIKGCFTIPPAAREVNISVNIHFYLNKDGSVQGQPEVVGDAADPVAQATARAAISAIKECQNYDLPSDQYDQWKENTLDFNPTQISG